MEDKKNIGFGTQIRKSPYFNSTVKWGATGFSVYNHMYIPRDFGSPEQNFWNLVNEAILCDVAVERQVEITGPDATKFSGPVISTCRSTATSHKIASLTKFQKFCSGDPKSRGMYI